MLDVAVYMHAGGHAVNNDALCYERRERGLCAALCDGLNGTGGGAQAADYCAQAMLERLLAEEEPREAILAAQRGLQQKQAASVALKAARTTACALSITGDACQWANVGDSRLYHFTGGALKRHSMDDSAAYAAFAAGETAYADLRLHPHRSRLTACLGEEQPPLPHEEAFTLAPGDALLVCSDGFWQYLYETEMEIDLAKAASADAWLRAMLLRLAYRSRMEGDNLSALCCRVGEGEKNER